LDTKAAEEVGRASGLAQIAPLLSALLKAPEGTEPYSTLLSRGGAGAIG
jgi:hypothetical protein